MNTRARRYTTYRASLESVGCDPKHLRRRTVTRPKWVRVGTRAFPYVDACAYYLLDLATDPTLQLRPIPREH